MKFRLILSAVFLTMTFASLANAQQAEPFSGQTRLLIGTEGGVWRTGGGYTVVQGKKVETISMLAGQTIQLQFARATTQGRIAGIAIDPTDPTTTYQVPCTATTQIARQGSGTPMMSVTDMVIDPFKAWATKSEWKGSCRLMVVKLSDGSEGLVRLRFK
jgi:hypothetical protein